MTHALLRNALLAAALAFSAGCDAAGSITGSVKRLAAAPV